MINIEIKKTFFRFMTKICLISYNRCLRRLIQIDVDFFVKELEQRCQSSRSYITNNF